MSSAATAQRSAIGMMRISAGSSAVSWRRSRPAGRQRSAGTSSSAAIAGWFVAPTTRAATGTVRSARAWRVPNGSKRGRPSCCRCRTSMSSSPCRRRRRRSRSRTSASVYAILFRAAAEAMRDVAADPRHLGAEIGAVAVLHTWGQTMHHHPHLHCIVPGGGLSPDQTRWVACRPGFLLPVRVLSRRFREVFVARLRAAFAAGELRFSGTLAALAEPTAFAERLAALLGVEWVVYAKPPFAGPEQVLAYLGRYTHRVAIANRRLTRLTDGQVDFTWKDYRHHGKTKVMTLSADEFIRRFLLHTVPDGFHRIRHIGFLANGHRTEKLALCRTLLAAPTPRTAGRGNLPRADPSADRPAHSMSARTVAARCCERGPLPRRPPPRRHSGATAHDQQRTVPPIQPALDIDDCIDKAETRTDADHTLIMVLISDAARFILGTHRHRPDQPIGDLPRRHRPIGTRAALAAVQRCGPHNTHSLRGPRFSSIRLQ